MAKSKSTSLLQLFGLHPIVAAGATAIDVMLFGGTLGTGGIGWLISIPVGMALAIATTFIQKSAYGDSWLLAAGKGLMLGLVTAIPTAVPSLMTLSSGALGFLKGIKDDKQLKLEEGESVSKIDEGQ